MDTGGGSAAGGFVILVVLAAIYFAPTMIAMGRKRGGAIVALNILLGWTLIGWVVALVWALAEEQAPGSVAPEYEPLKQNEIRVRGVVVASQNSPHVRDPVLLQPDGDNWVIESERGTFGRVEGDDARRIRFRAEASGKPRATVDSFSDGLWLRVAFGD